MRHRAALGLSERTMIVFAGDNGPTAWPFYYEKSQDDRAAPGLTGGLRGRKWSLYEGGIREPFIVRWRGAIPAGKVNETTVVAGIDLLKLTRVMFTRTMGTMLASGVAISREVSPDPFAPPGPPNAEDPLPY